MVYSQPAISPAVGAVAGRPSPDHHEDLLRQVVGDVAVAAELPGIGQHPSGMPPIEGLEGRDVPFGDLAEQGAVAGCGLSVLEQVRGLLGRIYAKGHPAESGGGGRGDQHGSTTSSTLAPDDLDEAGGERFPGKAE
jgi:hypothetical protein